MQVRVHLTAMGGGDLPSVEGVMLGVEYGELVIRKPSVLVGAGAKHESKALSIRIPLGRVSFYEELS